MMYLCVFDAAGAVLLSRNIECSPKAFLAAVRAFRDDLVVAVECMFTWYWLSDLCAREDIAFVLGHALYMRAIHGGKAKNDRIDAHKIAALLRAGDDPAGLVYTLRRAVNASRLAVTPRIICRRNRAKPAVAGQVDVDVMRHFG